MWIPKTSYRNKLTSSS